MSNPLRITAAVVTLAAVAALALSGTVDFASTSGSSSERASSATPCTVYRSGFAVTVTITSPAGQASCGEWIQKFSGPSSLWSTQPGDENHDPDENGAFEPVCNVAKSSTAIRVADNGGKAEGTSICGQLVSQGWEQQPVDTAPPATAVPSAGETTLVDPGEAASERAQAAMAALSSAVDEYEPDASIAENLASQLASDLDTLEGSYSVLRDGVANGFGTTCRDATEVHRDFALMGSDRRAAMKDALAASTAAITDEVTELQQAAERLPAAGVEGLSSSDVTDAVRQARRTVRAKARQVASVAPAGLRTYAKAQNLDRKASAACTAAGG